MLPCADSNDICDALFVGSHGLYEIFLLLDACKCTLECHTLPASKIFCMSSYDFIIFLTCFPEWPVSRHFFFGMLGLCELKKPVSDRFFLPC